MESEGPKRPEPKPVSLDSKTAAILVLDLSTRCHDPKSQASKLMQPVGEFLERVRVFSIPVIYTISASAKGTPLGEVASPLKRRETEPVIYPNAFDKFAGGELQALLEQRDTNTLVVVGSSTNVAVLYTCTTAARIYHYRVIIPIDGVIAHSRYRQEYSFHQLIVLPDAASPPIQFTMLSSIHFQ